MNTDGKTAGAVAAMWRYPVKSMMGEEINSTIVTERGLLGDRAYALVDQVTGKVVSAKNPRKWPSMFGFRAAFAEAPEMGEGFPPVRITMPDGIAVMSSHPNLDSLLSRALGSSVSFEAKPPASAKLEEYWPDVENLAHRETVTEEAMPPGTFFDGAAVHILTTSTLARLHALYPDGRFEARRFRPNLVVAPPDGQQGFVENDWLGCTLVIGSEVRLKVVGPTGRCVMTTLAQGDLPKDVGILKTAVQGNSANVGIYAAVERGGIVRAGDTVTIETSA
jgi:uncharacterized protein